MAGVTDNERCHFCGAEIIFRYLEGRRVPIHLDGSPCGERPPYSEESLRHSIQTRCPKCRANVYLVWHNGGSVWLNELGWPWPKHPCFDLEPEGSHTDDLPDNGRRTCEFCDRSVRADQLGEHIWTVHGKLKRKPRGRKAGCAPIAAPKSKAPANQGRRLCGLCNRIFDEHAFADHPCTAGRSTHGGPRDRHR
jgi:hypothetical protein